MINQIIPLYIPTLFLVGLTCFLIDRDKAFAAAVRREFFAVLIFSVALIGVNVLCDMQLFSSSVSAFLLSAAKTVFRPIILLCWLHIYLRDSKVDGKLQLGKALNILVGLGFAVVCLGKLLSWEDRYQEVVPFAVYMLCLFCIMILSGRFRSDNNRLEHVIVSLIIWGLGAAACVEYFLNYTHFVDNMIAVGVCLYYFYLIMQEYKYDALTNVPNRHNMVYDFEELQDASYLFTVVDIDNFKMINDKYGHDQGDRVLCNVVDAMKANLPGRCRIYRMGGDEFAVLSQGISEQMLCECFERVNADLEKGLTRISYGTCFHQPGEDAQVILKRADTAMYENKRMLKRDDIWDDMTGLYNLRGFLDELETTLKQSAMRRQDVCLVAFDIDDFENITLAYGYSEGNMLISLLADIIKSSLEEHEFVAHLGGNEFVAAVLTPQGSNQNPGKLLADKVNAGIRNAPFLDGKEYSMEVNAASDMIRPEREKTMEECVNEVLYKKKAEKENRRKGTFISQPGTVDKDEEAAALDIIRSNRLRYALQPIVSAKDGSIVGYEALMRTNSDLRLSPLTILRHAQNNDLLYDLEKKTFFNVLELMKNDPSVLPDKKIYINSIPGFVLKEDDYSELRERYGDLLSRVVMEITEQSELADDELAVIKERQLNDGFWVAIDDYGSGNSNTYSLLKIQPQIIKLDRLLIADINSNAKKQYFVNSIITFAKENGMKVLAEGVETEVELKMVIRLQVDYIQGFYTAKPTFDTPKAIPEDIRHCIVDENIRGVIEGKRKIFVASNTRELTLVQIALEEYTGITVSVPELKIIGNTDYTADMCIKIMDGLDCQLTLKDVHLSSVDELPCIEIGEGASLTLILEGDSRLDQKGIHVPDGSSLTVDGRGNLTIMAKGHDCYGIGCRTDEAIGNITLKNTGSTTISVDGELCAAIGGGSYRIGQGINVEKGHLNIIVAGVDAVGIGCLRGNVPIKLADCHINADFRVNTGSMIGSVDGIQNIELINFVLNIVGSGSRIRGIGGNNSQGGFITMENGTIEVDMSGQEVCLIGNVRGKVSIAFSHVRTIMKGEGNSVVAIGSMDMSAMIQLRETFLDMIVNSAVAIPYGADEANVYISNTTPTLRINE